jgi:hypothetical protein
MTEKYMVIYVHVEKLTKILNPSTPKQKTVTSFIRQSLELREGDSSQS